MRVLFKTTTAFLILLSASVATTAATPNSNLGLFNQSIRKNSMISLGAVLGARVGNLSLSWTDPDNRLLREGGLFGTENTALVLGDGGLCLDVVVADRSFVRLSTDRIGLSPTFAGATARNEAVPHGAIVFDLDANLPVDPSEAGQGLRINQFDLVLAPTKGVFIDYGSAISGQVVGDTFMFSGPELPFTDYDYARDVPELGAYGLIVMAGCVGFVFIFRTRRRWGRTWA